MEADRHGDSKEGGADEAAGCGDEVGGEFFFLVGHFGVGGGEGLFLRREN